MDMILRVVSLMYGCPITSDVLRKEKKASVVPRDGSTTTDNSTPKLLHEWLEDVVFILQVRLVVFGLEKSGFLTEIVNSSGAL